LLLPGIRRPGKQIRLAPVIADGEPETCLSLDGICLHEIRHGDLLKLEQVSDFQLPFKTALVRDSGMNGSNVFSLSACLICNLPG
jgi:hypothetical protein